MKVVNDLTQRGANIFNNPLFRTHLMQQIKRLGSSAYDVRVVRPNIAHRYQGNFYGLLAHMGVSAGLHYFTTAINGLTDPRDYDGEVLHVRIIRPSVVDAIRNVMR